MHAGWMAGGLDGLVGLDGTRRWSGAGVPDGRLRTSVLLAAGWLASWVVNAAQRFFPGIQPCSPGALCVVPQRSDTPLPPPTPPAQTPLRSGRLVTAAQLQAEGSLMIEDGRPGDALSVLELAVLFTLYPVHHDSGALAAWHQSLASNETAFAS